MKDNLIQHKKEMVDFALSKRKKKVRRLPKPPPPDEDDNNILTMTKFDLDKEFTRKKIRQTEVRTMASELDLARIREELLDRNLVEKQAAFMLVALRQKILTIPSSYARKIMHIEDIKVAHQTLQNMVYGLLEEIKNLPKQVVDPNWLETLDDEA